MLAPATRLTIEDFERLPHEETCDKELVDGELVDVSGNVPLHNLLRMRLEYLILQWMEAHSIGMLLSEQEYDFSGDTHAPDISFLRLEKLPRLNGMKRVQRFVPDLAIEIASPSDSYNGLKKKIRRYRQSGVEEVWVFQLEARQAEVFSPTRNCSVFEDGMFDPAPLDGFSVTLNDLYTAVS